jgi:hypothetical protein
MKLVKEMACDKRKPRAATVPLRTALRRNPSEGSVGKLLCTDGRWVLGS